MILSKMGDFYGYPDTLENRSEIKTKVFQRNNCGSNTGSVVSFSKTYTIYGTQQQLVNMINADNATFDSEGQTYANANGTCSTCPTVNQVPTPNTRLPEMYNGTDLFWGEDFASQPVSSGYTPISRQKKAYNFIDSTISPYTHYEWGYSETNNRYSYPHGVNMNASGNLMYGIKSTQTIDVNNNINNQLWSNSGNACSLGYMVSTLPDNYICGFVFTVSAITGLTSGIVSLHNNDSSLYSVNVYFTPNDGNPSVLLGVINGKTSDYRFYKDGRFRVCFAIDNSNILYIAILHRRSANESGGNLGIFYTTYLNASSSPSLIQIYNWNRSGEITLTGFAGRTNNNGAILTYYESGKMKSMGVNTGGSGNHTLYNESNSYPGQRLLANPTDNFTYLFINNPIFKIWRFNWSTNQWSIFY